MNPKTQAIQKKTMDLTPKSVQKPTMILTPKPKPTLILTPKQPQQKPMLTLTKK